MGTKTFRTLREQLVLLGYKSLVAIEDDFDKTTRNCDADSLPYLQQLGVQVKEAPQKIQFTHNVDSLVHGWSPYVQGFSASFVKAMLDQYQQQYKLGPDSLVSDPFAGCATVLVEAKLNRIRSIGTELNPLLHYLGHVKLSTWHVKPETLVETYKSLDLNTLMPAPDFLQSAKHFNAGVLRNLERLRGGITSLEESPVKDLLRLAFASILIDCSNLKRTPCLGYSKSKKVADNAPLERMAAKIEQIANDLQQLQLFCRNSMAVPSTVELANAMTYQYDKQSVQLAITSPPYMNGMDYVINYKIEMAWLDFTHSHREAKKIKDEMVVCDNVSRSLTRAFAQKEGKYTNEWLEAIVDSIRHSIEQRGSYRRKDMPHIVHKYFDDMYKVFQRVYDSLMPGGRFILVLGDSLIAGIYVPTDLLLARMGQEMGMVVEKIERARHRRSGQVRSYRLRETIVTLRKPGEISY